MTVIVPHQQATATSEGHIAVGIVADDLTGGGDSAVQFARDGWRTRLTLTAPDNETLSHASVLAVVSDARAQPDSLARTSTAQAVAALGDAGVNRLLLKIDSTMRGSAHAQILGALEAWRRWHPSAFAVVCPAYPAMGRTVQSGRVLVNGQGVETTAVGIDPVAPITTNLLAELVPGSRHVTLRNGSTAEHVEQLRSAAQNSTRVVTVDASTDADLLALAQAVAQLGAEAVPAGSAGLAVALSHVWGSDQDISTELNLARAERVIVVVSSLHDMSRSQYDHLVDGTLSTHVRTFAPSLDMLMEPGAIGGWIAEQIAAQPDLPAVVIVATPSERPPASAAHTGPQTETAAETIADGLATITAALFAHRSVGALVLMGGEGARAVLNRFGASAILVTDAIREGIPVGLIEGGSADGLTVVTKAGGFGVTSSISDILPELLADQALRRSANPNTGVDL